MDDPIAGTGVAHRALLMPSFMDNMLRQVELIRTQGRRFLSFQFDFVIQHPGEPRSGKLSFLISRASAVVWRRY
jgi:hypothetical protein